MIAGNECSETLRAFAETDIEAVLKTLQNRERGVLPTPVTLPPCCPLPERYQAARRSTVPVLGAADLRPEPSTT